MSSKFNTPKARERRRSQLERQGYDEDRIIDILEYEFDLDLGRAPGTSLPGKRYENGGVIRVHRRGTFKGVF